MGWTRETVVKVAKRTGYPVVEKWSSRNVGSMGEVIAPMMHHTGSVGSGDYPTLNVVMNGRSDLQNSLCMYGLGKSGTIYCISEKLSWHAGAGNWKGVTDGNGRFAGIEAESSGNGTDWTTAQLDAYKKLCASILIETGRDSSWLCAHKEYALPKGRKTDPAGIDMNAFRADVQKIINNPALLGIQGGGGILMALSDAEQTELLTRLRGVSAAIDWWLVPDVDPNPTSKGELAKHIRGIAYSNGQILALVKAISERDAKAVAAAIPADIAKQVAEQLVIQPKP